MSDDAQPADAAEEPGPAETGPAETGPAETGEDAPAEGAPAEGLLTGLRNKLLANLQRVIIGIGALAVVGGGVAGIYFSGILHVDNPREAVVALPAQPIAQAIQRITVDLKPSPRHARPFIRISITAELQGEPARLAFLAHETKIIDAIHSTLRDTTVEDLEGEAGTERLREDITQIINRIIAPEIAITVLYQDLLIR